MGYFNHHAIVVIGSDSPAIRLAHAFALETGAKVSEIIDSGMNGFASFFVAPDGSKEGWQESAAGDERRAKIIDYLLAKRLKWAEVAFPEGEGPRIEDRDVDE